MHKILLCFVLSIIVMNKAKSQCDSMANCSNMSCCRVANSLPSGLMLGHIHQKGEFMLSYRFMNMLNHDYQRGASELNADEVFNQYLYAPEEMHMNMHMMMMMYGLNDKLTLMAMVSYNSNSMSMLMYGHSSHHTHGAAPDDNSHKMSSAGLSDVKLYASYALWERDQHKVSISGGISLPTGSIIEKGESSRLPYMMQLGSGTYDILPALTYTLERGKGTFGAQTTASLRMGYNKLNYSLGNEYSANTWFSYKWRSSLSSSLRAEFTFTEGMFGEDVSLIKMEEPSADPMNYGGYRSTVFIGLGWHPSCGAFKNWQVAAEYGLPFFQFVNGIQMPVHSVLNANLNYTF